jgi:hypothetical protein
MSRTTLGPWARGLVICALLLPLGADAQDAEVEITQDALNQFLAKLGSPSDGGEYQPTSLSGPQGLDECESVGFLDCSSASLAARRIRLARCRLKAANRFVVVPAEPPVTFQWWITNARLTLSSGAMSLTATVRSHVGSRWNDPVQRTVPASVAFDANADRLRLHITNFTVPILGEFEGNPQQVAEVDVARLLAIAIPIARQTIRVPLLNGTIRTLTGRATSATPFYEAGRLRLHVNVAFQ